MFTKKLILALMVVLGLAGILLVACGQSTPVAKQETAITINTTSLNDGQVGIVYSQTLKASGGSGKYTWSVTGGSLPAGFALISNTGGINGTSSTDGTSNFTVQVSDGTNTATKSLSITIKPSKMPIFIDTSYFAAGEVGVDSTRTLSASGGSGNYTWSVSSGSLPDGMAIDAKGAVTGIPKTAGQFSFTIRVDDGAGASRDQTFNFLIKPMIAITNTSMADGVIGTDYYQGLEGTGGVGTFVWSISSGSLPDGLIVDKDYGIISGTPKTAGTFNFSLQAKDSLGAMATKNLAITIAAQKK